MNPSIQPKIYHIVHIDRLPSIIQDGHLWCDAEIMRREVAGPTIGMSKIKQQRFKNKLYSYPALCVSDCVPFYFCPRSIMLYVIFQANDPELSYKGGQKPILHLVADLYISTTWAKENNQNWVFTLSNAGSKYFEDRNNLNQLNEINWEAVEANK